MIDHCRRGVAAGFLMLLWAPVWAQQTDKPTGQPSAPQPKPAPQQTPPLWPSNTTVPQPAPPAQPVPPAPIATTTAPVTVLIPPPPAVQKNPPLGSEQLGKIRENEQHYREQNAAAELEFDARQAQERKEFAATVAGKGFWERRRQTREFRAGQARRRKEFDAEQEKKRLTYEWRYP